MILSMTGFGNCVVEYRNKKFTIEVKSLNSKQLDLATRIPTAYRSLEPEIRTRVARKLERGKSELALYVENLSDESSVQLNVPALAAFKKQIIQASEQLGIDPPQDWYSVLMRLPDAIRSDVSAELSDEERETILAAVDTAVDRLMAYRAVEGEKLTRFFTERISRIRQLLAEVPRYETQRLVKIRTRIEEGLKQLPQVAYDSGRLEQEMIFYIEKLDINEEKQRLTQHLDYFIATMDGPHSQGKKLGFISQEMGREINTLGSKSNQGDMQILVVKMKDELEQIKEQVLNAM